MAAVRMKVETTLLMVPLFPDVLVAARALATYLIPGCVGRGVRLGSEGSSVGGGGGGGVWKSGNLGIWRSGGLEIQKFGGPKNQKHKNSQNSNPFCPKCRQGLD